MKKLILALALTTALFACKKATSTPNTSSNPITCVDNPSINFTAIGTPVGMFSDCIKDIDGNVYKTVTIGTQTWMAENLKTSKYSDGTIIPNEKDSLEWEKLTTGAWCYYNNDAANNAKYGKLYNWYAVSKTSNGNKNVCPTGWHVPSDSEWTVLTDYLGGESVAGGKLKEVGTTNWKSPNSDATNTSLFSALPGGSRGGKGMYGYIGEAIHCWSSTHSYNDNAWDRFLINNNGGSVRRDDFGKELGFYVRCVKD
jgi:uncharacterized protein (TIGR02145 family)